MELVLCAGWNQSHLLHLTFTNNNVVIITAFIPHWEGRIKQHQCPTFKNQQLFWDLSLVLLRLFLNIKIKIVSKIDNLHFLIFRKDHLSNKYLETVSCGIELVDDMLKCTRRGNTPCFSFIPLSFILVQTYKYISDSWLPETFFIVYNHLLF